MTEEVVSPTFTLVNTYPGRLTVHHLDFYRVEPAHDLTTSGCPTSWTRSATARPCSWSSGPSLLLPDWVGGTARWNCWRLPGDGPDDRIWHLRGRRPSRSAGLAGDCFAAAEERHVLSLAFDTCDQLGPLRPGRGRPVCWPTGP